MKQKVVIKLEAKTNGEYHKHIAALSLLHFFEILCKFFSNYDISRDKAKSNKAGYTKKGKDILRII